MSDSEQQNTKNASTSQKIAAKRAGRLATIPDSVRRLFVAAWAGKCSPRQAIKAQCLECTGFDRRAIADCTGWACSLWKLRPFQKPAEDLANDDAGTVVSGDEVT